MGKLEDDINFLGKEGYFTIIGTGGKYLWARH